MRIEDQAVTQQETRIVENTTTDNCSSTDTVCQGKRMEEQKAEAVYIPVRLKKQNKKRETRFLAKKSSQQDQKSNIPYARSF